MIAHRRGRPVPRAAAAGRADAAAATTWSSRSTPEVERAAAGSEHAFGRGGMITKLEAARRGRALRRRDGGRATAAARTCCCASRRASRSARCSSPRDRPREPQALARVHHAHARRAAWWTTARRARWCERGKSLLPAGITRGPRRVRHRRPGRVRRRARPRARARPGRLLLRGDRADRRACRRARSTPVLGYSNGDEVIHRDDLVLVGGGVPGTARTSRRPTSRRHRRARRRARGRASSAAPSSPRRKDAWLARAAERLEAARDAILEANAARRARGAREGPVGAARRSRLELGREVARHDRRPARRGGAARPGRARSSSSGCGRTGCASAACASRSA